MKGYTIHLLFHLLALLAGGACGAAGGYWWFTGNHLAMWVSVGALVAGLAVLVTQLVFLSIGRGRTQAYADGPARSSPRIDIHNAAEHSDQDGRTRVHDPYPRSGGSSRTGTGTRPDLEPIGGEPTTNHGDSRPGSATDPDEEDTSVTATAEQRRRADPTTRRW